MRRLLLLTILSTSCSFVTGALRVLCGDGFLQEGEECDDGNTSSGDGCSAACGTEGVCGDGQLDVGESCDGANLGGESCITRGFSGGVLLCGDDCEEFNTSGCTPPSCGNSIVEPGEECDDGNASNEDNCINNCNSAICGDGFLREGVEGCDDGGTTSGDGCSAICGVEACGNGTIDVGERCFVTQTLPTDGFASRVLIGDLDDDGARDDVFACSETHFEPYFNNGVLVAQNKIVVGALGTCVGLTTGDFDGGGLDFALSYDESLTGTLVLLLQNGATPSRRDIVLNNTRPRELVSVELNGDGFDDLVLAVQNDNKIRTFINLQGSEVINELTTVADPFGLTLGDLNNDNIQDLAVSSATSPTASLFVRNAGGVLSFLSTINSGCDAFFVKSGDLAGDDQSDLVFGCGVAGTLSIAPQNSNGSFAAPVSVAAGVSNATGLLVNDLDGDGSNDVAVINQQEVGGVTLLFNNGSGVFTEEINLQTGPTPTSIAVGDLNNDSLPDLAISNIQSKFLTLILSDP